jgi:hypothetical protein
LLTAGLALHEQGRAAMMQRNFLEALKLLQHSEQAFDAVDDTLMKAIDNVGLMLLDLVWCAYMVQVGRRSHHFLLAMQVNIER